MKLTNKNIKAYFLIISFLFFVIIFFDIKNKNYLPLIYIIILFPFLMYQYFQLLISSSKYLKQNHSFFYNEKKSFSNMKEGKIVTLINISDEEIDTLKDPKVLDYKKVIRTMLILMILTFLITVILSLLVIYYKLVF